MGNALSRFIGIVIRPETTLREIDANPQTSEATIAIMLYVITNVFTNYLSGVSFPITVFFDWFIALITGIALCFIISLGLHFFAKVLGGSGKYYPNMYVAISFSFIILALSNVLSMIFSFIGLDNYDNMSIFIIILSLLITLIMLVTFIVWLGYLWFLSLKNIEKLKTLGAIGVASIGIVLFIILQTVMAIVLSIL
jgi:hypothetical protein